MFSRVPQFITGWSKRRRTGNCVQVRIKAWEIF
jgi:hypothetical protein